MGIEKVAGSSAVSYQGSAAAPESRELSGGTGGEYRHREIQPVADVGQSGCGKGRAEELMNHKQLKNAVSDLNKQLKNTEAVFGVHDKTNRITIKIVDRTTKEVLKEYPPEQTLDIIAKVWEIAGLLVDKKL